MAVRSRWTRIVLSFTPRLFPLTIKAEIGLHDAPKETLGRRSNGARGVENQNWGEGVEDE